MKKSFARIYRRSAQWIAAATLSFGVAMPSFALKNTDPNDPSDPGPLPVTVSGALVFRGCTPVAGDVTVRVAHPARTAHPSSGTTLADGSIRMSYSLVVGTDSDPNLPAQVIVTPEVSTAACGTGTFTPGSRAIMPGASGVNFEYQAITTGQFMIPVDTFVLFANGFLRQIGLHLNNDGSQGSFITMDGVTSAFDIAVVSRDLPGPTGSGRFFVRDMNLANATMARNGAALNVQLHFEQAGIEVKGYHSALGDNAMPDFQLSNPTLNAAAGLRVRGGQLLLGFTGASLVAGISSTGGCNVFGLDWCDVLFGTSGSLRSAFAQAALSQLQGPMIQAAIKKHLAEALASFGIHGTIGTASLQGDQIVITTIANGASCLICSVGGGVLTQ